MLGVAACFNDFRPGSRSNTNAVCKKREVIVPFLTTSIFIKKLGRKIVIPCDLLKHKVELEVLIETESIQRAVQLLMKKYDIVVPPKPIQEIKRYVYPTADKKLLFPVLAFNASFRLGREADLNRTNLPDYVMGKSYLLELCNDDTVTFSVTVTDMVVKAKYWLSTLNLPCYCIIGPTNGQKNQLISGYISYGENFTALTEDSAQNASASFSDRIIFTALIFNSLYLFYEEYAEDTPITIFYKTKELSILTNYLNSNNLLDNFRNNAFNLV
jgi:hypothetical protein